MPVTLRLFVASSASLGVFCVGADYIIFQLESVWSSFHHGSSVRAVLDSLVHGIVGGWCWINVLLLTGAECNWLSLGQVILCVTMAAGIDLDHMIEAKSFNIQDALHLSKRPFAHNTSLLPLVAAVLLILQLLFPPLRRHPLTHSLPLMFSVSMISHHLRDADRRGLWCAPFGSTPAIPYKGYVILEMLLSLCVAVTPLIVTRLKAFLPDHKPTIMEV